MSLLAVLVNPFHYQRKGKPISYEHSKGAYRRALEIIGDSPVIIHHSYPIEQILDEEAALIKQLGAERDCLLYPNPASSTPIDLRGDWLARRYRDRIIDLRVFGEPLPILPSIAELLKEKIGTKRMPALVIPGNQRDPGQKMRAIISDLTSRYYDKLDFILEDCGNA